jgi:hypothetical protein
VVQLLMACSCAHGFSNTIYLGTSSLSPQVQLSSALVKLLSIDPSWKIECGFLQAMCDGSGGDKLEDDFLKLLPTEAGGLSLDAAIQQGTVLVSSKLASFASPGCVGSVRAALNLLVNMQCGQSPKIPAQSTAFMQSVFARVGFFATFQGKTKSGEPGPVKRGRAAVQANLAQVSAKDVAALDLKDLELLCVYSFLLPETEQAKVKALTEQVFKTAGGSEASKKPTPSSSASGSGSRSSKSKPSQASMASSISEAAAMFK